jgi:hypothetical protein
MKFFRNGHPSSRKLIRISAIGVACLGLLGVASVAEAQAPAAAGTPRVGELGACTANTGVIVYVDFSAWKSGRERGAQDIGCAPTPGASQTKTGTTTGLIAMTAAGFSTDGTSEYGEAFTCRIGVESLGIHSQEPDPAQESCTSTPDDYWAYWHAEAGSDTWSLSGLGADNYDVYAGSIDAWNFEAKGGLGRPTLTPDEVRAEEGTTTVKPALTVSPARLKSAYVGQAYTATLSTSGGKGPYTYAVNTQGPALPAGLSLSSSGVVSGTPTATGTVNVVVDLSAAPITRSNPLLSPPDGYTGPDLGTIAVHIAVESEASRA